MKPKAVIFDVDGTVALRDKGPDGRGPFDWDRVGEDLPNEDVLVVARMIGFAAAVSNEVNVFFFSGRKERARDWTEMWLDHHFAYPFELWLRGDSDNRPDDWVKKEMLDTLLQSHTVVAAIDDRNQVVDMWRANDVTCFQVCSREDGDF